MSDVTRRDVLKFLAAAPLAGLGVTAFDIDLASTRARDALEELAQRGQAYTPRYFSPAEWRTVRILVDLIIPRDERSGSATEAGVPEFMDFTLGDRESMRQWVHEGLAWLDAETGRRFNKTFAECAPAQRTALLDDIAWPKRAPADLQSGVRFFNRFRDFTASGFWSSKMGVQDLGYIGNTPQAQWKGCPPAALRKLGVNYKA
jgi:gluconate 2-dehydrogenase subunit 3-like protein